MIQNNNTNEVISKVSEHACGTSDCTFIEGKEFHRCMSVMPIISVLFLIWPIFYTIRVAIHPKATQMSSGTQRETNVPKVRIGMRIVPKNRSMFVLVATVVALVLNMFRLYLSVWITEELFWETKNPATDSKGPQILEWCWRFGAVFVLYLAFWSFAIDMLPTYEILLFACYCLWAIWDILAFCWKKWFPWRTTSTWASVTLTKWLILDILGCVFILVYIIILKTTSKEDLLNWSLGFLTVFYFLIFMFEIFSSIYVDKEENKIIWIPWELFRRKLRVIRADDKVKTLSEIIGIKHHKK